MQAHRILILCALVLLTAAAVGADVKVVQEHHQDGFTMMGQDQPATDETHVTWIGEQRIRMDQGSISTIVNLPAQKMYIVNHDRKTYNEVALPVDLSDLLPPGMDEQMMAMMKFDVSVTPTGETKKIGPWTATRYDMTMTSPMMEMRSELWATTETPIDFANYYDLYSSVLSLQPGMDSMVEAMRKIDGYVVDQNVSMSMKMMGDTTIGSSDTVVSIDEMDAAPEGTYDPPAGYELQELDYMKMMQGQ